MIYYRCKCGNRTAFGSMPPPPCSWCSKCKSNLAMAPESHSDPKPHDWYTECVDTDEGGGTRTRCRWCGLPKSSWSGFIVDGKRYDTGTGTPMLTGAQIKAMAGAEAFREVLNIEEGDAVHIADSEIVDVLGKEFITVPPATSRATAA